MDEKLKEITGHILSEKSRLLRKLYRLQIDIQQVEGELEKIESTFSMLAQHFPDIREAETNSKRPKTVGEMALAVLENAPRGLKASEILELIQKSWMPELVRTSLSPPLSRLKKQGLVKYNNGFWSLNKPPYLKSPSYVIKEEDS